MTLEQFDFEPRVEDAIDEIEWESLDSALELDRRGREQRDDRVLDEDFDGEPDHGPAFILTSSDEYGPPSFSDLREAVLDARGGPDREIGGGSVSTETDGDVLRPTLVNPEDNIRVTPVYVETLRVTTENDNRVHNSLCGQTHVEPIGEDEWRITIEGGVTESQLRDLIRMRPANNELRLIASPTQLEQTGQQPYQQVEFDSFTYEYTNEEHRIERGDGTIEPYAQFQLQAQNDDGP